MNHAVIVEFDRFIPTHNFNLRCCVGDALAVRDSERLHSSLLFNATPILSIMSSTPRS